jgi:hypothetical protein
MRTSTLARFGASISSQQVEQRFESSILNARAHFGQNGTAASFEALRVCLDAAYASAASLRSC